MRLASIAAVALLAACSAADQVAAPKQERSTMPAGAPSLDVIMNAVAPDSLSADFTVTPTGGLFVLGAHAVYFPDHSICDPATSGYGPDLWNAPCTPLDQPIDFHAEVRTDASGRAWVDFTPAVRFVPTDDPNHTVWVMMKTGVDVNDSNYMNFGMKWLPSGSPDQAIDESVTDSTLKSFVDLQHDIVFRRVKHFSGYLVGSDYADVGTLIDVVPAW
ncbi:MAG: hypothetical protein HOQ12_07085 [Gemmatimonadaceae bacterium]|nr:hypothetical protein [Gemmatimonadaceae bacterium]NUR19282.1 hypothetical protein [Gemmatimonadaceae bacterium]